MTEREITKLEALLTSMRIEQAERFARMEANLDSHMSGLTALKALVADVEGRIHYMEIHGSSQCRAIKDQVDALEVSMDSKVGAVMADVSTISRRVASATAVLTFIVILMNLIAPAVLKALMP